MITKEIAEMSRIVRNDVGFDLAFISQNYTMLQDSPKQILPFNKTGVIKRRGFVALLLQFFPK